MNLPGVVVDLPTFTDQDKSDIIDFGIKHKVDFIAASFVRKASDVANLRKLLADNGGESIKIICKIENQEGLQNYDEILHATDSIMVARGDLGMEIPAAKVFLAQKMMIRKANIAGKSVITATQVRFWIGLCTRSISRFLLQTRPHTPNILPVYGRRCSRV
jgi:pyruvate kinase